MTDRETLRKIMLDVKQFRSVGWLSLETGIDTTVLRKFTGDVERVFDDAALTDAQVQMLLGLDLKALHEKPKGNV